jgi:hypothetical protein
VMGERSPPSTAPRLSGIFPPAMHELSLATEVVRIICDEAGRHGLARVERYRLEVGQLRAVVPELLRR